MVNKNDKKRFSGRGPAYVNMKCQVLGRRFAWLVCVGLAVVLNVAAREAGAAVVVTNADATAVFSAVAGGGLVRLAFTGSARVTESMLIATNTTIDASGCSVVLDAEQMVRHFVVTNSATLKLVNLTLVNGRHAAAAGQPDGAGDPGLGGSIANLDGNLELIGCRFISNSVVAGQGGPAPGAGTPGGPAYGGAVYSSNGRFLATNCVFFGNSCTGGQGEVGTTGYTARGGDSFGGAVFATNGSLSLIGVVFSNNLAKAGEFSGGRPSESGGRAFGGALANGTANAILSDCVFVTNRTVGAVNIDSDRQVRYAGAGLGGAVFQGSGEMNVHGTVFEGNSATGGGGAERQATIRFADGYGGAIFNQAALTLQSSALVFNRASGGSIPGSPGFPLVQAGAGYGGGIFQTTRGTLSMINCTVAENSANGGDASTVSSANGGPAIGGGIANQGGVMSLLNVTFARNAVHPGKSGAAGNPAPGSASSFSGDAALTNTILFCLPGQTNVSSIRPVDGGHNISSDASASFTATSSRNSTDPLLGPLGNYGGTTPTVVLLPGSPAIDSGDISACSATDQRGVARPIGVACDIGAYEFSPRLTLSRGAAGQVTLEHVFYRGETNQVRASTNLTDWPSLGTRVSDANGRFEFEDQEAASYPQRFYQVAPQRAE